MSEWRYDESSGSFRRSDGSGGGYNAPRRKKDNGWISWGLIVFLFIIQLWPIGLILLILKLSDGSGAKRPASRDTAAAKPKQRPAENVVTQAAKQVTKSPDDSDKTAKLLKIIGAAVMGLFGLAAISEAGSLFSGWADWPALVQMLGLAAGGAVMFRAGSRMQTRRSRIQRYQAIMGDRDYVGVEELAAVTGRKRGAVEKDIDYMLQKNMLGTGAFFDAGHGILFRSADAYQKYLREISKKENLTPKEANEGYSGALRAIREANDRIPDPVFSEKLDRMEQVAGKIFREVEEHPEKLRHASTFFNYYLPTTLKLLGTYSEFEEAGIEGENLRQAKERIESIMDNLLENFERQLDELYRSEAMDVDADIRVMENMLERDLGSVERDFGLGGSATQTKIE